MNEKHTPDPLGYFANHEGTFTICTKENEQSDPIEEWGDIVGVVEKEADAKLYAAAPVLLEAVINAKETLVSIFGCSEDGAQLQTINSAIKKATGVKP